MSKSVQFTESDQAKFILEKSLSLHSDIIDRLRKKDALALLLFLSSVFAGAGITSDETMKIPMVDVTVEKMIAARYLLFGAAVCVLLRAIDFLNATLLHAKVQRLSDKCFAEPHLLWSVFSIGHIGVANRLKSAGFVGKVLHLTVTVLYAAPAAAALILQLTSSKRDALSWFVVGFATLALASSAFAELYFSRQRIASWLTSWESKSE